MGPPRAEERAAEAHERLVDVVAAVEPRPQASELVQEVHAREFLDLVPHAELADVSGARHMVAGDRNDAFGAAILDFLGRLPA